MAGYSPDDITVEIENNILSIKGNGLDSITSVPSNVPDQEDTFQEYSKESRPRIHIGSISRGIARRKFLARFLISEEFDTLNTSAVMKHGLLHVIIPVKETQAYKVIKIKDGSDERD